MLRSWQRRLRLRLHLEKKMSFEEVRNASLNAVADGFLHDEEFIIVYDYYQPVNPPFPYWNFDPFCFDVLNSCECEAHFRVAKDDIPILLNAFRIPASFKCPQGTVCSGLEGLCLLLKRLAYPCRYFDLISTFGRPVPELCMIANSVLDWVFNEHGFRLTSWNQPFLTPACLQEYACAIARQGSPLTNCFGFIDGTVRPICRPGEKQRVVYNGHKRVHALKFYSSAKWFVSKSLWSGGGCTPRCRDAQRRWSAADIKLREAYSPRWEVLSLYGDPAYPIRPGVRQTQTGS